MELNEQTLEQILTRQREEYQRHLDEARRESNAGFEDTRRYMGVLAEGLRSDIQAIAEGHIVLRDEIRGIRKQLTDLDERVTHLEGQVAAIASGLEAMRTDLEIIKSELAVIRHEVKDKAEREEVAALEARVVELERTVRSH